MTTDNQPISAVQAAALLLALLPELARAETYPQWSDGTGAEVRRQRVTLYDDAGDILGADRDEHRSVLWVLMQVEGGDWDRPQTFDVAAATLSRTYPVVASAPLWLSPMAAAFAAPDAGALLEQRHQLEDPAEPPLGGAQPDPGRDCARSLADGLMQPVAWGDDAPCEPEFVERDTVDVPVQGGAL